jgi:hypothetical protein
VPHDTRDTVVDFVRDWSDKTDLPVCRFLPWIGITSSKFHDWKKRFGKVNEHNARIPRDHWLTDDEKDRIRAFARAHPLEGYRRLTFMMLDADVAACSPASVYRVLRAANLLAGPSPAPSKKGTGFVQPLSPHDHWHIDVSYLNIAGAFYFLCSVLDGCSRFIVHHEIREKMEEADVEVVLQRPRTAAAGAAGPAPTTPVPTRCHSTSVPARCHSTPGPRLPRHPRRRPSRRSPPPARLQGPQRPRPPTARALPAARFHLRDQSLLLRPPRPQPLPLLQVQARRQRPRPLGRGQTTHALRRRPRPLRPAWPVSANPQRRERRRGTRSAFLVGHYNATVPLKRGTVPVTNSTRPFFQFTLSQNRTPLMAKDGFVVMGRE